MINRRNQDQLEQHEEHKVGSLPRDDVDVDIIIDASDWNAIEKMWYPYVLELL